MKELKTDFDLAVFIDEAEERGRVTVAELEASLVQALARITQATYSFTRLLVSR